MSGENGTMSHISGFFLKASLTPIVAELGPAQPQLVQTLNHFRH